LTDARPAARLAVARAAVPRAIALSVALAGSDAPAAAKPSRRRGAPAAPASSPAPAESDDAGTDAPASDDVDDTGSGGRAIPASDRRRGVEVLVGLWASMARDIALVGGGGTRSVADPVLLEEIT